MKINVNSKAKIDNSSTEQNKKIKKVDINFDNYDKFFIIQKHKEYFSFIRNSFETIFLLKLLNAEQNIDIFKLKFSFDNLDNPHKIDIIYQDGNEQELKWAYKIL